jgi:hypothetical protein
MNQTNADISQISATTTQNAIVPGNPYAAKNVNLAQLLAKNKLQH